MVYRKFVAMGVAILISVLFTVSGGNPGSSLAQGGLSRAAVVFRLGSGQVIIRQVSFDGASITGLDLAQASGLPIVAWSNLVCKVGPEGCDNPATYDECFCQCTSQSGKCEFWRYFHWQDGEWRFSGTGAADYAVPPEGIDGWAWGDNDVRPPEVDPDVIWDTRRLAPGLAQVAAVGDTLNVQIDLQGDENHNSAAMARYRRLGEGWNPESIALSRTEGRYSGEWRTPSQPGDYEVNMVFTDIDGISGSASITETVAIAGSQRIHLPMLLAFGPS